MKKVKLTKEEYELMVKIMRKINKTSLEKLDLSDFSDKITPEHIAEFKFTGLNNIDFIECEFWNKSLPL